MDNDNLASQKIAKKITKNSDRLKKKQRKKGNRQVKQNICIS
jgi:hypothetical protein